MTSPEYRSPLRLNNARHQGHLPLAASGQLHEPCSFSGGTATTTTTSRTYTSPSSSSSSRPFFYRHGIVSRDPPPRRSVPEQLGPLSPSSDPFAAAPHKRPSFSARHSIYGPPSAHDVHTPSRYHNNYINTSSSTSSSSSENRFADSVNGSSFDDGTHYQNHRTRAAVRPVLFSAADLAGGRGRSNTTVTSSISRRRLAHQKSEKRRRIAINAASESFIARYCLSLFLPPSALKPVLVPPADCLLLRYHHPLA
jgi:hypothetical protein